jgi:hypothetical protein
LFALAIPAKNTTNAIAAVVVPAARAIFPIFLGTGLFITASYQA